MREAPWKLYATDTGANGMIIGMQFRTKVVSETIIVGQRRSTLEG